MEKQTGGLDAVETATAAEDGVEFELKNPGTEAGTGMFVTVYGVDAEVYREKQQEFQRMRRNRLNKTGRFFDNTSDLNAEALELTLISVKGWRGFSITTPALAAKIGLPVGEISCTAESKRKVLAYPGFAWIREQIDQQAGDRSNFLQSAASAL